jgi:hypothetical protein
MRFGESEEVKENIVRTKAKKILQQNLKTKELK